MLGENSNIYIMLGGYTWLSSLIYAILCVIIDLFIIWLLKHPEVTMLMPTSPTFTTYDVNELMMVPGTSWMGCHTTYWMK